MLEGMREGMEGEGEGREGKVRYRGTKKGRRAGRRQVKER